MTATEYKHIQLRDRNVPIIAGTTLKVIELIEAQNADEDLLDRATELQPVIFSQDQDFLIEARRNRHL